MKRPWQTFSERARLMAEMICEGKTQRVIGGEFNVTPARVSQIVSGNAIRLWKERHPEEKDGYWIWHDVFHRDTYQCAVYLLAKE